MKEIDTLRAPECLDTVSIGLFAEGKLGDEEKQRAEEHLLTCLYCLKQLVDMKEMLYYEKHPTPISPELVQQPAKSWIGRARLILLPLAPGTLWCPLPDGVKRFGGARKNAFMPAGVSAFGRKGYGAFAF